MQNLYQKLLKAPKNSPVFLTGKLDAKMVLEAYKYGLFPWTSEPVSWWCVDPRMILKPREIYTQKSLKRFFNRYKIKLDTDFEALIKMCASAREKSWISEDFIRVYSEIYTLGFGHCVSVYESEMLVGGIYGLILGKVFFGESMVSAAKNASKVALIRLCELLAPYDFIIDCQVPNSHLKFMGAKEMPRVKFLKILEKKVSENSGFEEFKALITHEI